MMLFLLILLQGLLVVTTLVSSSSSTLSVTSEQCDEIRRNAVYWKPDASDPYNDADAIVPRLYVGNVCAAHNASWLRAHRVTIVISVAREWPSLPLFNDEGDDSGSVTHFHYFDLDDVVQQDETLAGDVLNEAATLIHRYRSTETDQRHDGILVHCNMGISRSASVVLAYLQRYQWPRLGHDKILRRMRAARPVVRPNNLFGRLLTKEEL